MSFNLAQDARAMMQCSVLHLPGNSFNVTDGIATKSYLLNSAAGQNDITMQRFTFMKAAAQLIASHHCIGNVLQSDQSQK